MQGTLHIFDFLEQDASDPPRGLCVFYGGDRFLKRLALQHLLAGRQGVDADQAEDSLEDFGVSFLEAETASWPAVENELASRSLFAPAGPKYVILDDADKFVSQFRDRLESYLASPKPRKSGKTAATKSDPENRQREFSGLLILMVHSWAANTRLFKQTQELGLQIKCDLPELAKGSKSRNASNRDQNKINQWLIQRAAKGHQFQLSAAGAELVSQLTDFDFGRMDQELQKLALYSTADTPLSAEEVQKIVGGWQTKTTWDAIDAAVEGKLDTAMLLLDQLLKAENHPVALLGQIAWSLRRFSHATEMAFRQRRRGKKIDTIAAMREAGFPNQTSEKSKEFAQLKKIGSVRGREISNWLLQADRQLKLSHSKAEDGRLVLELLLTKIGLPASGKPALPFKNPT